MKRYQLLGLALAAVFAFSAVMAVAAGAVTTLLAEWLSAGAKITTAQTTDAESSAIVLVNKDAGGFGITTEVSCSGIFDGTVGPASAGTVEKLLTLAGVEISNTVLVGAGLACTNLKGCTEPKVWANGLPWKSELELMIDGTETFFTNYLLNAGYYVECLILGITANETCTVAETAVETKNLVGGTVEQVFSDPYQVLAGLKLANCSGGGTESAEVTGPGTLLLTSGAALTASSE